MNQTSFYPVHPALRRFFQAYLVLRVNGFQPSAQIFTAKPAGALMFAFGGKEKASYIFNGNTDFTTREGRTLTIDARQVTLLGLFDAAVVAPINSYENVLYAVFTPTGISHFLKESASAAVGSAFSLENLGLEKPFGGLVEQLLYVEDDLRALRLAERYLLAYFSRAGAAASARDMTPVADFIRRQNGAPTVGELEKKFRVGRRWLEKEFVAQIGVPPKTYARIVRFNALTSALADGRFGSFYPAVEAFGYHDHSHLHRDFQKFAGQSPTQYIHSRQSLIDGLIQQSL